MTILWFVVMNLKLKPVVIKNIHEVHSDSSKYFLMGLSFEVDYDERSSLVPGSYYIVLDSGVLVFTQYSGPEGFLVLGLLRPFPYLV